MLQKWGWVQEMYAFAISVYLIGVRHVDLVLHLMAQPPWDARMELSANKPFYILHYTYGNDFTLDGKYTPGGWGEPLCVCLSFLHEVVARATHICVGRGACQSSGDEWLSVVQLNLSCLTDFFTRQHAAQTAASRA